MPFIQYPNVPSLPGVPQVLRPSGAVNALAPVLAAASGVAQILQSFTSKPQWGIYKHVDPSPPVAASDLPEVVITAPRPPAVTPDSFRDFGYRQNWKVTSAPIQNGGFSDFNRVATPFENHLRMTKGGDVTDRVAFLKQVEALNGTTLYDIVTPERVYLRVNLTDIEYERRGMKGAYWLDAVDVYFREVRPAGAQALSASIIDNPKSQSAASVINSGIQRGVAVAKSASKSIVSALAKAVNV